MINWYYWEAAADGYAVNANTFKEATKEKPVSLEIGPHAEITGLQAVPVKKGRGCP